MEYHYFVLFFTLIFAYMLPSLVAKFENIIAGIEDYEDPNAGSANAVSAMEAYNVELLEASLAQRNASRRDLHECVANNPIDKCWRCKCDWADNRKALAQCVIGFAKGTTGGAAGEIYTVTDPSDEDGVNPKPGTLRYGAAQKNPLWIIFEKDMVICLKHTLLVTSDKTIDGRGAKVEIANGGGISILEANNVIIHGIDIHDVRAMDGFGRKSACEGDAVTIKTSTKVWIDHCTLSKGPDGLLDVTLGSTDVTISNCRFHHHDKVVLLGADDSHSGDKNMRVTVAYNKFEETCVQRMPRIRFGFVQVVNNDYNKWILYALGGSANPTIFSQGNRFVAPDNPDRKVVLRWCAKESESANWKWKSENDILENGATFLGSGTNPQLTPEQQQGMIEAEPGSNAPQLTSCAGVLSCVVGTPC